MTTDSRHKWFTLAVVGAAFFMTILDVAIVNVALPSIQKDLNIAESTVQWVVTAYAITFGGFLLLGGRMADLLGRRLIFMVGLTLFTLVSLTGGLALLVYAISKAPDVGWLAARTIALGAAALAILAGFVVWEMRTIAPLVPFSIFRIRPLTAANVAGLLTGAVIFANFFILTLYVQQVLGWSALRTGLTFLATAGTVVVWAGVAQGLVTKVGPRPILPVGFALMALVVLGYTRLPVHGHYWPDLLPFYLVFALGLAFS